MILAIPLVVVLGVAGVYCPRFVGRNNQLRAAAQRAVNLTPPPPAGGPAAAAAAAAAGAAEERQILDFDRCVGIICPILMVSHQWRMHHRLGGLDRLQIVLLPLPGEGWKAALQGNPPAAHGCALPPATPTCLPA